MMFKKIFFLLIIFVNVFAIEYIKDTYIISSHDINSTLFFKEQKSVHLYTIPEHEHSLRIKKIQLEKLLKQKGFKDFDISSRYIHFEIKSPIDTTYIKNYLKGHYEKKYDQIDINSIYVEPRSYMEKLPQNYKVNIRKRNYLSREGILSIEDNFNKKYFFNYIVDASLKVVTSREKINRNEELSQKNTKYKTVKLDRFYDKPLQKIYVEKYQAKYKIKVGEIITKRDIKKLSLVKKDTKVSVFIYNSGMSISFAATALQNGKLNDIITIQKSDGKRLKAKVVAKQRVEVR